MFGKKKKNKNLDITSEKKEVATEETGEVEEVEQEEEISLYMVHDNATLKVKKYLHEQGIGASRISDSIASARDMMMISYGKIRTVIVDTGTGKFTNIPARKELVDLIGIMDADARISVFYTDEALKAEVKETLGKRAKEIQWKKYSGTLDMVVELKKLDEKYKESKFKADLDKEGNREGVLSSKGLPVKSGSGTEKFKYVNELLRPSEVVKKMAEVINSDTKENSIVAFKEIV